MMAFDLLKRMFCTHRFEFERNLYGDQIIEWGYKRSVWRCGKCGKRIAGDTVTEGFERLIERHHVIGTDPKGPTEGTEGSA